jgi:hypothetical protein
VSRFLRCFALACLVALVGYGGARADFGPAQGAAAAGGAWEGGETDEEVSIVGDHQDPPAFRVAYASGRDRVRVPTGGGNIAMILGDESSGVGDSELIEMRGFDTAGGLGLVLAQYSNVAPVRPFQFRQRFGGIDDLAGYAEFRIDADPYDPIFSLYLTDPSAGPRWSGTPYRYYDFTNVGLVLRGSAGANHGVTLYPQNNGILSVARENGADCRVDITGTLVARSGILGYDAGANIATRTMRGAATITDATETTVVTMPTAQGGSYGATVHYTVFATDGTDMQGRSGVLKLAFVNKAGTFTFSSGTPSDAGEVAAVSAGTLSVSWVLDNDGDSARLRVNADTSLTPTSMRCNLVVDYMGTASLNAPTIP